MTSVQVESALSAAPELRGELLAALPEDQWFERKSAKVQAKDLGDCIIGFVNADGGVVIVGLRAGRVEGTDRWPKLRNAQLQAGIDFCEPPVRVRSQLIDCLNELAQTDHLLLIEVEPTDEVHANKRDETFLRVGDENRRLTFAQRQELHFDKGQASYEARVSGGLALRDLDGELAEGYRAAVGAPDLNRLLGARGLAVGDRLTIAGALLFAVHPQVELPEAYVRVLRYRGRERGAGVRQQLTVDERFEGPIPRQLLGAQARVRELQPFRRALRRGAGRFGLIPLVPEDAWLEGLVNAVIHRSYSLAGDHVRVEIFDDRIEIWSPGRFLGLVDLRDPAHVTRFARNPRIARVSADLSFGQELGEGIRRMFEEMRAAGLSDPIYRQTSSGVRLSLLADPVDRALDASLSARGRSIMNLLREQRRLSTGEVVEALGESRPVVQRELRALADAGAIVWVGKSARDPRAYWMLK